MLTLDYYISDLDFIFAYVGNKGPVIVDEVSV